MHPRADKHFVASAMTLSGPSMSPLQPAISGGVRKKKAKHYLSPNIDWVGGRRGLTKRGRETKAWGCSASAVCFLACSLPRCLAINLAGEPFRYIKGRFIQYMVAGLCSHDVDTITVSGTFEGIAERQCGRPSWSSDRLSRFRDWVGHFVDGRGRLTCPRQHTPVL